MVGGEDVVIVVAEADGCGRDGDVGSINVVLVEEMETAGAGFEEEDDGEGNEATAFAVSASCCCRSACFFFFLPSKAPPPAPLLPTESFCFFCLDETALARDSSSSSSSEEAAAALEDEWCGRFRPLEKDGEDPDGPPLGSSLCFLRDVSLRMRAWDAVGLDWVSLGGRR